MNAALTWLWRFTILLMLLIHTHCMEIAHADNERRADYIAAAKAQEWKYQLPLGLLGAVCEQESRWNPGATSSRGALGVCQIMPTTFTYLIKELQRTHGLEDDGIIGPKTWQEFRPGVPYVRMTDQERLYDPFQNIEWAAFYLKWIETHVDDDPTVMLGVYYAGQRNAIVRYQRETLERWQR